MEIQAIHFRLKDGREAVLRNPVEADVPGTLEYLRKSAEETEFILRYPEECDRYTEEKEKALFEETRISPQRLYLICEVEGRIAGNCDIAFGNHIKNRHRGSIGIALIKEFWNLGIGTKMFETLIRVAEARPEVTQIELDFVEGNSRARALYEKMGFRIAGVHPNAIRLKDGRLLNNYLMIREIHHN